jgi:hypothetical protein
MIHRDFSLGHNLYSRYIHKYFTYYFIKAIEILSFERVQIIK